MRKIAFALTVLALTIGLSGVASAAADNGRSQGSWWFSIDNQLGFTGTSISPEKGRDTDSSNFSIGFRPVYFVMDGLGIEPSIAYMSSDIQGDGLKAQEEIDYGIGLIYALQAAGGYPYAGFGWNWSTVENYYKDDLDINFGEIKAGYIFEVKPHFGLGGEVFYDFGSGEVDNFDYDITRYGVRVSISGLAYK